MNEHEDLARMSKAHRLAAVIETLVEDIQEFDLLLLDVDFWKGAEFLAEVKPAGHRTKALVRQILEDMYASRARVEAAMSDPDFDPFKGLPS